MRQHDFWAYVGLTGIAFAIVAGYVVAEGLTANSIIYLLGTVAGIALAVVGSRFGNTQENSEDYPRPAGWRLALKDFFLKRGLLFVMIQAPILTFFSGFFFRWVSYSVAAFIVLVCFMLLPAWVSYRKSVSNDPDEPVHHLGTYLICALVAGAAFSIIRIPLHYGWGYVYWSPWFAFGSELSGLPANTQGALAAGAILYSMHAITLGLAYYVLFKRHTLLNAMLLLAFYLSSLYSLIFPIFGRFGQASGWVFHVTNWVSHIGVALATWYALKFWRQYSAVLKGPRRAAAIAAPMLALLTPIAFAFYRTETWIAPTQHVIDQSSFNQPNLVSIANDEKIRLTLGGEARLQFNLRIGARTFKNYDHKTKALDAQHIRVDARIKNGNTILAWCWASVENLESPNRIKTSNADYFAAIERLNYTEIPVICVGPAQAFSGRSGSQPLAIEWTAKMRLIGDREQALKSFSGIDLRTVATDASVNANATSGGSRPL